MKTKAKKMSSNLINPVDAAITHICKAQLLMRKELQGGNPLGMYSEFATLIKLLKMYQRNTLNLRS